jgi:uncharacterized protein YegP (UPF0339 family)
MDADFRPLQGGIHVPAKFIVKKGSTGKFSFTLVSTNGQVVAQSQAYESKRSATAGIASVRKIAAGAGLDDLTVAKPAAKPAAKKPAAKKPAAKAAARKPAAKPAAKAAARKPAVKKTAARKR